MALRESARDIESAGAKVVAVTQGDGAQAKALCDRFGVSFPCLADPERSTFRAFGLKRGSFIQILGPAVLARGLEAAGKGHHIERVLGDAFQLPGTFIVDSELVVRYARYARNAADHPPTDELIEALRRIRGNRAEDPA